MYRRQWKTDKRSEYILYLRNVVTRNENIQNEISERIKRSQFYHIVNGLLRNKDNTEKCKRGILNIYFKKVLYGAETWAT